MFDLIIGFWLLCFFGGPAIAYSGYLSFRRIRKMEDTPTARTATAAMGEVKLQGFAWPANLVKAPLHQSDVVLFEVTGFRDGGPEDLGVEVFRVTSHEPFFLADDRGLTMIKIRSGDEINSETRILRRWSDLDEPSRSHLLHVILSNNPNLNYRIFVDLQIEEKVIFAGDRLYVHGEMTPETENDRQRTPSPELFEFMLSARKRLIIEFIKNQKQLISQDAPWARTFLTKKKELARIPTENPWMTWSGVVHAKPDQPLFLGDQWETELKEVVGKYHVLRIVVGGILFAIGFLPFLLFIKYRFDL